MKVTLITHGTRGDVQPMLAVGEELRRRGHVVTLGVPPNLTATVEHAGFTAVATGPDSAAILRSEEGQRWLAAGDVKSFMAALAAISHAHWDDSTGGAEKACADADVILSGVMMEDIAA